MTLGDDLKEFVDVMNDEQLDYDKVKVLVDADEYDLVFGVEEIDINVARGTTEGGEEQRETKIRLVPDGTVDSSSLPE